MKKHLITLLLLTFISQHSFSQTSSTPRKYGSNRDKGKYITIDKIKVYYESYGQGTPLLLLHGGLGSIVNFEKCIPELSTHYLIIAVDSPGHGRSSQLDSLSYSLLSTYLSQFIDHLKLDSLYIMGWSDGGILGLMLAAERADKVKKIIAVGANTRVDGLTEEAIKWLKSDLMIWAKNNPNWSKTYLSLTPQPEKLNSYLKNSQKMWFADSYFPQTKIESIKVPTLILQGDRDMIKLEHALEMHRIIPHSQLCILPNTSHSVFNEQPDFMNEIAINFFNSLK